MDRFTQMLEKTLMPIAEKVEQNRYLSAIREGFTSIMPFLIIEMCIRDRLHGYGLKA